MAIRAVVFDVGETLIDETRLWTAWADRLGLPRLTFLAALGAVIARGGDHRTVFGLFRPGFDVDAVQARRRAAGEASDLRRGRPLPRCPPVHRIARASGPPDRDRGKPAGRCRVDPSTAPGSRVELIASSARWGVEKPSPFFARIAAEFGLVAGEIARMSAIASTTTSGRPRRPGCSRSSSGAARGRGSRPGATTRRGTARQSHRSPNCPPRSRDSADPGSRGRDLFAERTRTPVGIGA